VRETRSNYFDVMPARSAKSRAAKERVKNYLRNENGGMFVCKTNSSPIQENNKQAHIVQTPERLQSDVVVEVSDEDLVHFESFVDCILEDSHENDLEQCEEYREGADYFYDGHSEEEELEAQAEVETQMKLLQEQWNQVLPGVMCNHDQNEG